MGSTDGARRVQKLRDLEVLDGNAEEAFDNIARLAQSIAGTSFAGILFADATRGWFKSAIGLDVTEVPLEGSFCEVTLAQNEPFMVGDASLDARFVENPVVAGGPKYRCYLGVPIIFDGDPVGTVCVLDSAPRLFSDEQVSLLQAVANQVTKILEIRAQNSKLDATVNELKTSTRMMENVQRRSDQIFENLPVACWTFDETGTIHEFNAMAKALFGHEPYEVQFQPMFDTIANENTETHYRKLVERVFKGESIDELECVDYRKDGTSFHVRQSAFPVFETDGRITKGICSTLDISARVLAENQTKELAAKMEQLANTDGLTGLRNRRSFFEISDLELKKSHRYLKPMSVVIFDVDHFKMFNDTYGHQAGDDVLRQVATVAADVSRDSDVPARYGGEEFVVLLTETGLDSAMIAAERLRSAIESRVKADRKVTASFGVASLSPEIRGVDQLIQLADEALYASKAAGRNCVTAYGKDGVPTPQPQQN